MLSYHSPRICILSYLFCAEYNNRNAKRPFCAKGVSRKLLSSLQGPGLSSRHTLMPFSWGGLPSALNQGLHFSSLQSPLRIYDLICVYGTKKWFQGWSLKKWLKTIISNPQHSLGEGKRSRQKEGLIIGWDGHVAGDASHLGKTEAGRARPSCLIAVSYVCVCWGALGNAERLGVLRRGRDTRIKHSWCYLCPDRQIPFEAGTITNQAVSIPWHLYNLRAVNLGSKVSDSSWEKEATIHKGFSPPQAFHVLTTTGNLQAGVLNHS